MIFSWGVRELHAKIATVLGSSPYMLLLACLLLSCVELLPIICHRFLLCTLKLLLFPPSFPLFFAAQNAGKKMSSMYCTYYLILVNIFFTSKWPFVIPCSEFLKELWELNCNFVEASTNYRYGMYFVHQEGSRTLCWKHSKHHLHTDSIGTF